MNTAILKPGQKVSASLSFQDAGGNAANPASPPQWSLGTSGVVDVVVADDGLSASFDFLAPGSTTVDVVAEGDVTPGVDTVHLQGTIQCFPAEIATGSIDFGPPQ